MKMERKVFYTIIQRSKIMGVESQDGFEVKIGETILYAYVGECGRVFVIDPQNGTSLFEYSGWRYFDDDVFVSDIVKIERAMTSLEDSDVLQKWEKMKEKESYTYTVKMFDALMDAQKYREKYGKLVKKGR